MERISATSILNSSPQLVNEIQGAKKFSLRPGDKLDIIRDGGETAPLLVVVLEGGGSIKDIWETKLIERGETSPLDRYSKKISFRADLEECESFTFLIIGIRY